MKLKHPMPIERINPKEAVPNEILTQYPWHWDPMQKDHSDDLCFLKKLDFDWKGLGDWAIDKCNEKQIPDKYWWYDDTNDTIMHANDNVNSMPIHKQAELALKHNTHNKT